MKRMLAQSLLAIALMMDMTAASAAQSQETQASTGKMPFLNPVTLRGTLGELQIQATLRNKAELEEGIEGEYVILGKPQKVLLAGELEGDDFFLEESENGKDVSGQWTGKLVGDIISGEWQSVDGKLTKPFTIRLMRSDDKVGTASTSRSSGSSKQQ